MAETIRRAVTDIIRKNYLNDLRADDEESVKLYIVQRLFAAAGWHFYDKDQVSPEYGVEDRRVDYALLIDNEPQVFVEVKKLNVNLHRHQHQLMDYCENGAANLAVLTNGRHWWMYLPSWEGSWEEKRFCTLDLEIDSPEDVKKAFEDFLRRDRVGDGKAVKFAKRKCRKQRDASTSKEAITKAWNRIIQTPHEDLIRLITSEAADISKSAPEEQFIRDFLDEHEQQFDVSEPSPSRRRSLENLDDLKNSSPNLLAFHGTKRPVERWIGVLSELCQLISNDRPGEFEKVLEGTRGSGGRRFFSKGTTEGLTAPSKLPFSSEMYMERSLSTKQICELCDKLVTLFEYQPDTLEIQGSTEWGEPFTISFPLPKRVN